MTSTIDLDSVERLTRDVRNAAVSISAADARFMVDAYYQMQEYRKATANQQKASVKAGEPVIMNWLLKQTEIVENQIKSLLDVWSGNQEAGQWAKSIIGIGPVIAAGLLTHIDIRQAPTVGHIWRFAGLDPTQQWLGAVRGNAETADAIGRLGSVEAAIPGLAAMIGTRAETLRKLATSDAKGKALKLTKTSLSKAAAKRP